MQRNFGEKFENYRARIKKAAEKTKEYLAGRIIHYAEGPGKPKGRKNPHFGGTRAQQSKKKYKVHRKRKKKLAYASKRKNRMRA